MWFRPARGGGLPPPASRARPATEGQPGALLRCLRPQCPGAAPRRARACPAGTSTSLPAGVKVAGALPRLRAGGLEGVPRGRRARVPRLAPRPHAKAKRSGTPDCTGPPTPTRTLHRRNHEVRVPVTWGTSRTHLPGQRVTSSLLTLHGLGNVSDGRGRRRLFRYVSSYSPASSVRRELVDELPGQREMRFTSPRGPEPTPGRGLAPVLLLVPPRELHRGHPHAQQQIEGLVMGGPPPRGPAVTRWR